MADNLFRDLALALPEAAEKSHFGKADFRVRTRIFAGFTAKGAAYVNLIFVGISGKLAGWLGLSEDPSIWISFVLSMALLAWIMRKG